MRLWRKSRIVRGSAWTAAIAIAAVIAVPWVRADITTASFVEDFSTTTHRDASTTTTWDTAAHAATITAGTHWEDLAPFAGQSVSAVACSPTFANDHTVVAGTATAILRSIDGGTTWTSVAATGRAVTAVALSPAFANDGVGFAMTNGAGLWRTQNHGATWVKIHASLSGFGLALAPGFASDHTVFVGAFDRIMKSVDGGSSWTDISTGIDDQALLNGDIRALAISQEYTTDQTVYIGTLGKGIYRSSDAGGTWELVNPPNATAKFASALAADTGGVIVVTLLDETFRSTDRGGTWTKMSSVGADGIAHDPTSTAIFFATEQGVLRWDGTTASYGSGWTGGGAQAIAVAPTYPADGTMIVGRGNGASLLRTGYAASAVAVSTAVDAVAARITTATLTPIATLPAGTAIAYHLSVADNAPSWEGPVNPGVAWTFQASGSTLRWRATLTATSTAAPTLNALTIAYTADDTIPAPTIGATVPQATVIRWQFTDHASDETGFELRDAATTLVVLTQPNATAIDESNLRPNTTYCNRRVVAMRSGSASSSAVFPCTTTLARTPSAPRVVGTTSAMIALAFDGHPENPPDTLYAIRETTNDQDVHFQSTAEVWKTAAEWNNAVDVRGLNPNTTYTFCLRARNREGGETPCAPLVSATTTPAAMLRGDVSAHLDAPVAGASVLPSSELRVAMTLTQSGVGNAGDVVVTIPIPSAFDAVHGGIRVDGTTQTDVRDGDPGDLGVTSANAVTFVLGDLSTGESRTLSARLAIPVDAAPGSVAIAPMLVYRPHPTLSLRTVVIAPVTVTIGASSAPMPIPPTPLPPVPGGSPSFGGGSPSGQITIAVPENGATTNATTLTVRGHAFAVGPVTFLLDAQPIGTTTTGADGAFTFVIPNAVAEGPHALSALTTGAAAATTFRVDRTPPAAPSIDSVRTVRRQHTAATGVFDTTVDVRGHIPPAELSELDAILISVASDPVTFIMHPSESGWQFTSTIPLAIGAHTVTAVARDRAGNRSVSSASVAFVVPPPVCVDATDNDGDGQTDFPNDPDCASADDDDEATDRFIPRLIGGIRDAVVVSVTSVARVGERVAIAVQRIIDSPQVERVAERAAPAVVVAVAASTAVAAQGFPFLAYLQYLVGALSPARLLAKRKRVAWGVVYASLSKRPVDLAVVRLVDAATGAVVQSAATDALGRYQFLVRRPGTYQLTVQHPWHTFPSTYLHGKADDGTYDDLYTGGTITVDAEGTPLARNIPIDASESTAPAAAVIRKRYLAMGSTALSTVGLLASIAAFAITPEWWTFVLGLLNFALFAMFRRIVHSVKRPKSWGSIRDASTHDPIRHAIVRVFDREFNKLLETVATDGSGRYQFLVGQSVFYVTAEKSGYAPAQSSPLDLRRRVGMLRVDLNLTPQANG